MIFIFTNKRDITVDFIILELKKRGADFLRINTEDLPKIFVHFGPRDGWILNIGDKIVPMNLVGAAYYRRPSPPMLNIDQLLEISWEYCQKEWATVLDSFVEYLDTQFLNSPSAIARAENKPLQISMASNLGFHVPDTLISNEPEEVRQFVSLGPTIAKPLRCALVSSDGEEKVIFTTDISLDNLSSENAIAAAPVIYQRKIEKAYDIRVTVVGDQTFSAAIMSQIYAETQTDWRRGSRHDLPHEIHLLPHSVATMCIELTKVFNLSFGAIDLILDKNGKYWFLEINPNGQWGWIEVRTGLPIAAALAEHLISRDNQ